MNSYPVAQECGLREVARAVGRPHVMGVVPPTKSGTMSIADGLITATDGGGLRILESQVNDYAPRRP